MRVFGHDADTSGRQSHQCPTITPASWCSACSLVITFVLVSIPLSFFILLELGILTKRGVKDSPELRRLSQAQKELKLRIENITNTGTRAGLKKERNRILHSIRRTALKEAELRLDEKAKEVEKLRDGARMFKAVQLMRRRGAVKPTVADNTGKIIVNEKEAAEAIGSHFSSQFSSPSATDISPFQGQPRPLQTPITSSEIAGCLGKLNNGRAAGDDSIPTELMKYASDALAPVLTSIFNGMFEQHEVVDIGSGSLIPLQKPNKPLGPPSNLRPIVLLNTLRKTLSLLTLARVRPKVDQYLAQTHSGFRPGRSTADVVWAHRWLVAKTQRYHSTVHLLGIDLWKAFDTIKRDTLLTVLEAFLSDDDVRLIRVLISNTRLRVQLGRCQSESFATTKGTPQGDCLSPVLFTVYLEAALRQLRQEVPARPLSDNGLPLELVYADDADFVSTSKSWLADVEATASTVLPQWSLIMNRDKTEYTDIFRSADRIDEEWRTTRKLGSLLGDEEDIMRRKQLATAAFQSLWSLWKRHQHISEKLRLRLYSTFIVPVLTYNSGTWGVSVTVLSRLDSFHRRQLRSLIGVKWPQIIPNDALYARCEAEPLSVMVKRSRWRLFGHILRMADESPAVMAMSAYFANQQQKCWRGRPRTTLPQALVGDLRQANAGLLGNLYALQSLRAIAHDRPAWRDLCMKICAS